MLHSTKIFWDQLKGSRNIQGSSLIQTIFFYVCRGFTIELLFIVYTTIPALIDMLSNIKFWLAVSIILFCLFVIIVI